MEDEQPWVVDCELSILALKRFKKTLFNQDYDNYSSNWSSRSSAVMRVARELKERGVKVGGIVSRELKTNNTRIGFEFIDLTTNDRNVLASITGNG